MKGYWNGAELRHFWDEPSHLMDTNPMYLEMIERVRQYLGFTPTLPFVDTKKRKIVIASREPELRKKAKLSSKRVLKNENDLVRELRAHVSDNIVQVEFSQLNTQETLKLLEDASIFLGYHGSALNLAAFLPRGACLIEILPIGGKNHLTAKAAVSGKLFMRYMNKDLSRQSCCDASGCKDSCSGHDVDLEVDVNDVVRYVTVALDYQRLVYQRHEVDNYA